MIIGQIYEFFVKYRMDLNFFSKNPINHSPDNNTLTIRISFLGRSYASRG